MLSEERDSRLRALPLSPSCAGRDPDCAPLGGSGRFVPNVCPEEQQYAALSLQEKERFVSSCLLHCDLDGEVALNFLQRVVARDRNRLVEGLKKRPTSRV